MRSNFDSHIMLEQKSRSPIGVYRYTTRKLSDRKPSKGACENLTHDLLRHYLSPGLSTFQPTEVNEKT